MFGTSGPVVSRDQVLEKLTRLGIAVQEIRKAGERFYLDTVKVHEPHLPIGKFRVSMAPSNSI